MLKGSKAPIVLRRSVLSVLHGQMRRLRQMWHTTTKNARIEASVIELQVQLSTNSSSLNILVIYLHGIWYRNISYVPLLFRTHYLIPAVLLQDSDNYQYDVIIIIVVIIVIVGVVRCYCCLREMPVHGRVQWGSM